MLGEQSSSVLNGYSQHFQDSGTPQRPGSGIKTPFIVNDKVRLFFRYVVNIFTTLSS